jgi:hypothetical protein
MILTSKKNQAKGQNSPFNFSIAYRDGKYFTRSGISPISLGWPESRTDQTKHIRRTVGLNGCAWRGGIVGLTRTIGLGTLLAVPLVLARLRSICLCQTQFWRGLGCYRFCRIDAQNSQCSLSSSFPLRTETIKPQ